MFHLGISWYSFAAASVGLLLVSCNSACILDPESRLFGTGSAEPAAVHADPWAAFAMEQTKSHEVLTPLKGQGFSEPLIRAMALGDFSGFGHVPGSSAAIKQKKLRYAWIHDPWTTFNPLFVHNYQDRMLMPLLYRSLFERIEEVWQPALAMEWRLQDNGCTLAIRVGTSFHWSDGTKISKADVLKSLRLYADPQVQSTRLEQLRIPGSHEHPGGIIGFEDGDESWILCKSPQAIPLDEFMWRVNLQILPAKRLEAWLTLPNPGTLRTGKRVLAELDQYLGFDSPVDQLVTSASWKVLDYHGDGRIELGSIDGTGTLQNLELRAFETQELALRAYKKDEIDLVDGLDEVPVSSAGEPAVHAYRSLESGYLRVLLLRPGFASAQKVHSLTTQGLEGRMAPFTWWTWLAASGPVGSSDKSELRQAMAPGALQRLPQGTPGIENLLGKAPTGLRLLVAQEHASVLEVQPGVSAELAGMLSRLEKDVLPWSEMVVRLRFSKDWAAALLSLDETRLPSDLYPLLAFHDPGGDLEGRYPGPQDFPARWALWAASGDSVIIPLERKPKMLISRFGLGKGSWHAVNYGAMGGIGIFANNGLLIQ